jgi:nitrite reductase (NADH) small subunit
VKESVVGEWVRLCAVSEAPKPGEVAEAEVKGVQVCLANVNGTLSALENICPHRGGPLGQGWLEGGAVVCPWHSWCFDTRTGQALPPDSGKVDVLPVKVQGDEVWIDIE